MVSVTHLHGGPLDSDPEGLGFVVIDSDPDGYGFEVMGSCDRSSDPW